MLDAPRLTALGQGGAAIDDWLPTYGRPPPRLVALADDEDERS